MLSLPSVPPTSPRKVPTSAMLSRIVCQAMTGCCEAELGAQAGLGLHRPGLERRQRAGGAGELPDEHPLAQLRQPLAVALDRREQPRHLVAERHGDGLLQVAATDHRGVPVLAGEARQGRRDRGQLVVDQVERLADLQHRGGVGDVLGRGAPVAVLAEAVAAEGVDLVDHGDDGIADALGLPAQLDHVDLVEAAVADDLVGRLLRDDAELALHLGQGGLDVEVVLGPVLVGPDGAHLVGAEDALEDVGVDDGGRHGGSPIVRDVPGQCAARARVRRAARTTGRSIMRPSSWAAPGDAASAAEHASGPLDRLRGRA